MHFDWREIANRFNSRGVTNRCPRCGAAGFDIGDEPFALIPVDETGKPRIDAASGAPFLMPVASARCSNCGFVALHTLDALE